MSWSAPLFWASVVAAIFVSVVFLRYRPPPAGTCVAAFGEMDWRLVGEQWQRSPLPAAFGAQHQRNKRVVLRARLIYPIAPTEPQAILLDEATPYVRARINGIDLTSSGQSEKSDTRFLGPQLLPIAAGLLRSHANALILELPLDASLGQVRVGRICVGDYDLLMTIYRGNWWRQVGITRICLALLLAMAMLSAVLWMLRESREALNWYLAIVALAGVRIVYDAFGWKPAGVVLQRFVADAAVGILLWAMSKLISRLWDVRMTCLQRMLAWLAAAEASLWALRIPFEDRLGPMLYGVFLVNAASAVALLWAAKAKIIGRAQEREFRLLSWAILFGSGCGAAHAITVMLSREWDLQWTYALSVTVIAGAFMLVLLRRVVLGIAVLRQSRALLGIDMPSTWLRVHEPAEQVLGEIVRHGAQRERQRVLRDIHDGFGSSLVGVLGVLRQNGSHAQLYAQVQRALLDMRLMVDALDEELQTLDVGLAILRHRVDPLLDGAGIAATWDLAGVDSLKIVERRRLLQLMRCLEEVVSNAVQHSRATRMHFQARIESGAVAVTVTDNGCGFSAPITPGQGLKNIGRRIHALNGTWRFEQARDTNGVRIELVLPYI